MTISRQYYDAELFAYHIMYFQGGLIAKRLLAYPQTINTTNLAITLAAPLEAPVINFDQIINEYYMAMNEEWALLDQNGLKVKKSVISIGSGPRDILMPAGLTSSADSNINVLVYIFYYPYINNRGRTIDKRII